MMQNKQCEYRNTKPFVSRLPISSYGIKSNKITVIAKSVQSFTIIFGFILYSCFV